MSAESVDIVILGGGINGAALARDAAMRGLRVRLIERHDFGFGASSKTSKLAHGGLRYLQTGEFKLVSESVKERDRLLKNASNHVTSLPFIFPVYKDGPHSKWKLKIGLSIYDWFSRSSVLPPHKSLDPDQISALCPDLKQSGLLAGFEYYDAQMNDTRLIFENIRDAEHHGAICQNYTDVIRFHKTDKKITGLTYRDESGTHTINCQQVINATGAWANDLLIKDKPSSDTIVAPTKGTHIVVPTLLKSHALILHSPIDQRVFFICPWNDHSLIGTTDTDYTQNPDLVRPSKDDITYLLRSTQAYFPNISLNESSVRAAFSGLRPLVKSQVNTESGRSRNLLISSSKSGLTSMIGGKYTSFRSAAESCLDHVIAQLPKQKRDGCKTKSIPLESTDSTADINSFASRVKIDISVAKRLSHKYPGELKRFEQIFAAYPESADQICPHHPHIKAELYFSLLHEHIQSVSDWMLRRTRIGYGTCPDHRCCPRTANICAEILGWSGAEIKHQIRSYLEEVKLPQ